MPKPSAIARHWAEWEQAHGRLAPWASGFWDHCEPSCMACGLPYGDPEVEPSFRAWDGIGLERCHIVPRLNNGLDVESNLVLMCKPCHDAQPQSIDPEITFCWMRERTAIDRLIGSGYVSFKNGELVPTSKGDAMAHQVATDNGIECVCTKCDPGWSAA